MIWIIYVCHFHYRSQNLLDLPIGLLLLIKVATGVSALIYKECEISEVMCFINETLLDIQGFTV